MNFDVVEEVSKYVSLKNWREECLLERRRSLIIKTLFLIVNQMIVLAVMDEGVYSFLNALNNFNNSTKDDEKTDICKSTFSFKKDILQTLEDIRQGTEATNVNIREKILINRLKRVVSKDAEHLIKIENFKKSIYFFYIFRLDLVSASFLKHVIGFIDNLKLILNLKKSQKNDVELKISILNKKIIKFWRATIDHLGQKLNRENPERSKIPDEFNYMWTAIENHATQRLWKNNITTSGVSRMQVNSEGINEEIDEFLGLFAKEILEKNCLDRVDSFCNAPLGCEAFLKQIELCKDFETRNVTHRKDSKEKTKKRNFSEDKKIPKTELLEDENKPCGSPSGVVSSLIDFSDQSLQNNQNSQIEENNNVRKEDRSSELIEELNLCFQSQQQSNSLNNVSFTLTSGLESVALNTNVVCNNLLLENNESNLFKLETTSMPVSFCVSQVSVVEAENLNKVNKEKQEELTSLLYKLQEQNCIKKQNLNSVIDLMNSEKEEVEILKRIIDYVLEHKNSKNIAENKANNSKIGLSIDRLNVEKQNLNKQIETWTQKAIELEKTLKNKEEELLNQRNVIKTLQKKEKEEESRFKKLELELKQKKDNFNFEQKVNEAKINDLNNKITNSINNAQINPNAVNSNTIVISKTALLIGGSVSSIVFVVLISFVLIKVFSSTNNPSIILAKKGKKKKT